MQRLIITGPNGAGKSHLAQRLSKRRPDLRIYSYDALRLTQNWQKRPQADIETAVTAITGQDSWVLEGGPSLLLHALHRSEGVIWLDPPTGVRACRLVMRPWKTLGQVRDGLPEGNVDWPLQQYIFALRSLAVSRGARRKIARSLNAQREAKVWRCTNNKEIDAAVREAFEL